MANLITNLRNSPCAYASDAFGQRCCGNPSACNLTNTIAGIRRLIGAFGIETRIRSSPSRWMYLKKVPDEGDLQHCGMIWKKRFSTIRPDRTKRLPKMPPTYQPTKKPGDPLGTAGPITVAPGRRKRRRAFAP